MSPGFQIEVDKYLLRIPSEHCNMYTNVFTEVHQIHLFEIHLFLFYQFT